MTPLRLEAPAKLNLSLAVVGLRADGFHELVTEMVLLDLADRLLLLPGCSGLRVEALPGEDLPLAPGENLAWRGLVAGLGHEPDLACLSLEKRIPAAAGLGGGSSDAAAAWRMGRRWTGRAEAPTEAELEQLSRIGADVPFFAAALPAARVGGIGERVAAMPPPGGGEHVVLVHAPFPLPTPAVFAELRATEWSTPGDPARNDLLAPARRIRPELDELIRLVTAAGGQARMSGSGPTLFARTDDPERATSIAGRLGRAGVRATLTRLRPEAATIEVVSDDSEEE